MAPAVHADGLQFTPADVRVMVGRVAAEGPGGEPFDVCLHASGQDPAALAASLWDLAGWSARGRALVDRLGQTVDPASRLRVAAHIVRHLTDDPLLPSGLLPRDWPGGALRSAYADYQSELRRLTTP